MGQCDQRLQGPVEGGGGPFWGNSLDRPIEVLITHLLALDPQKQMTACLLSRFLFGEDDPDQQKSLLNSIFW